MRSTACATVLIFTHAAAATPDLWAHWGLNEPAGPYAIEDARGYYGVYMGQPSLGLAGFPDECGNSAVGFDGADDFVRVLDGAMNLGAESLTVVARFRKATDAARPMRLLNKGLTPAGTPANAGYALAIRDGSVEFAVSDGGPIQSIAAPEPAPDAWHFVAGVLDRDAGEARLYVDPKDASPAAVAPLPELASLDTNIHFAIGALTGSPAAHDSEHFEGRIDDVRVYRGALTGEQVLALAGPPHCRADIAEPAGMLDLADIQAFLAAFADGRAGADFAPPCGLLDLDDVNTFVASFLDGCGG